MSYRDAHRIGKPTQDLASDPASKTAFYRGRHEWVLVKVAAWLVRARFVLADLLRAKQRTPWFPDFVGWGFAALLVGTVGAGVAVEVLYSLIGTSFTGFFIEVSLIGVLGATVGWLALRSFLGVLRTMVVYIAVVIAGVFLHEILQLRDEPTSLTFLAMAVAVLIPLGFYFLAGWLASQLSVENETEVAEMIVGLALLTFIVVAFCGLGVILTAGGIGGKIVMGSLLASALWFLAG